MTLDIYTGGFVATNAYLLTLDGTTLLIDAPAGVFEWLQQKDISPDHLLLTHQHFDHVEDAALFTCPIHAFSPFSRDLTLDAGARAMGLPVTIAEFQVGEILAQKEALTLGKFQIRLEHVPGHSPDSMVFSIPDAAVAIVGDTLFQGGVGRTDLPGGDHELLIQGIRKKILTLPPQTRVYPGHGPATTPAAETANNSFLASFPLK